MPSSAGLPQGALMGESPPGSLHGQDSSYIVAQSVWSWVVGCFKICSQTKLVALPPGSQMDKCPGFLRGDDSSLNRLELGHRLATRGLHLRVRSAVLLPEGWVGGTPPGA